MQHGTQKNVPHNIVGRRLKYLVNTQLLDEAIQRSGIKTSFLIEKLGISNNAFYKKKNGQIKWRKSEIYVVQDILRLSDVEVLKIFFN